MFWNMCRTQLPEEVIADLDKYVDDAGMCRMDCGKKVDADHVYSIKLDGKTFEFHEAQLPPPSGTCAVNYSR